jgi:hypothetical protein
MGNLRPGHLVEAAFWLGFAALAFIFSFEFDRAIDTYKLGATTWPRAVILLIALAAAGQLYWHWRFGDEETAEIDEKLSEAAASTAAEEAAETPLRYYLRLAALFAVPLLYAYFMSDLGFYAMTPFFILAVLWLLGERRWRYLLGVTVFAYALIVIIFAKFLYVGLPTGSVSPFYDYSNWLLVLLRGN